MEDLIETLTRGNVVEVKVVLASVVAALAVYQLILIAVGYSRLRPPFLGPAPAARAHRIGGDAIAAIAILVAIMCVSGYGFEAEDAGLLHVVAGVTLVVVLGLKIAVVRRWRRLGHLLPYVGTTLFVLFMLTWASAAGDFLFG